MQDKFQHTDKFFDSFRQAFESYEPEVSSSDIADCWNNVKSSIQPAQSSVPNSLVKNITLKGIGYVAAGLTVIATAVIILVSTNKNDSPKTSETVVNTIKTEDKTQENINTENGGINENSIENQNESIIEKSPKSSTFTNTNITNSRTLNENGNIANTSGNIDNNQNTKVDQNSRNNFSPVKLTNVVFSDTILCVFDILKMTYNPISSDKISLSIRLPDGQYIKNFTGVKNYQFNEKGKYQIVMEYSVNGSIVKKSQTIHVFETPYVFYDFNINQSSTVNFTNFCKGNNQYVWNFGDGTSSELVNPVKVFTKSGVFQVILKVTNQNGCISEMSKYLTISLSASDNDIYIPNTFSPNNDGNNDYYFVTLENEVLFEITIVDRYGKTVFASDSKNERWDGRDYSTGKECPDGSYFFVIKYQIRGQEIALKKTGAILLNR